MPSTDFRDSGPRELAELPTEATPPHDRGHDGFLNLHTLKNPSQQ